MKTTLLIIGLFGLFLSSLANSDEEIKNCDVCSATTNANSLNVLLNNKSYIGLNYLFQNYKTYNGIFNNSKTFNEKYNTIQIAGRINMIEKWLIDISIPLHFHNRILSDKTINQSTDGIGDLNIQSSYQLLSSDSISKSPWKWYLGGGLKIPFAEYENQDMQNGNPNFNLGSGAWDFYLSSRFQLNLKNSGINVQLGYALKTENKDEFKFGNQTDVGFTYFRSVLNEKKINPTLLVGIKSEFYDYNEQFGYKIKESNGYLHQIQFGSQVQIQKFNVGFSAFIPVKQDLMNQRIKAKFRNLIYIRYSI